MVRSYEVSFEMDEDLAGWLLLCYEGDETVYTRFFRDYYDAHEMGNLFLDGHYVKTLSLEDLYN